MIDIDIGNAYVYVDEENLMAFYEIERVTDEKILNDPNIPKSIYWTYMSGNSFGRTSGGWENMFKRIGLEEFRYRISENEVIRLTQNDVEMITVVCDKFKDDPDYDIIYWLKYWITWAVNNCKIPALKKC